jgi:VWFA-related protein
MFRFLLPALLAGALLAQNTSQPPAPAATPEDANQRISVTVQNVVAPTWVYDAKGNYVNGLRADQFHLFDNGKEQNIKLDETFEPISMVIMIQANSAVQNMLPTVSKIGSMISPLILGDRGEAAVVAYDSRIRTLQEFTSDPDKITMAVKKIQPGSTANRLVDAYEEATRMLRTRPSSRRRIILMIGEKRDIGSAARGRETLINMQLANITLYSVDMSRLLNTLNAPTPDVRPDTRQTTTVTLPPLMPSTPTTVMQTYGTNGASADFVPLLVEIYRDAKSIFKSNPVTIFTKGTGGTEYNFYRGHGLEQAIEDIGEQVHAEYIISYSPSNQEEGGFHQISMLVDSPLAKRVQTRPGYWLAARIQ